MAMVENLGGVFGIKRGQGSKNYIYAYDRPYNGKPNGIHIALETKTDADAFVTALEPLLDGVINSMTGKFGRWYDAAKVIPNDTVGDSSPKLWTVTFSDSNDVAKIYMPNCLMTKLQDIKAFLIAQSYKDASGTALTVLNAETMGA
jgi:hypothetical protein